MAKGKATKIDICGATIKLGDMLKVRYKTGKKFKNATIQGEVVELWSYELNNHLQGRLSNGWCFHNHDEILEHQPS